MWVDAGALDSGGVCGGGDAHVGQLAAMTLGRGPLPLLLLLLCEEILGRRVVGLLVTRQSGGGSKIGCQSVNAEPTLFGQSRLFYAAPTV